MRYSVAKFDFRFCEEWRQDVFLQSLFDLGFDSGEPSGATGEAAYYIPTELLDANRTAIEDLCRETEGVTLRGIEPCPDENWNAAWEAEHPMMELPLGVRIVPHCAFGAGHHETTTMMIDALLKHSNSLPFFSPSERGSRGNCPFVNVLDHGTGTGVLAIFAKKLGAHYVLATDIDEKSVENAKENAALNGVEIDVRQCNTIHPTPYTISPFNLILANIHRNVLLAYMADYAAALAPGGELWLSGFYETDCPALIASAASYGLQHLATHANADWRMLTFIKQELRQEEQ